MVQEAKGVSSMTEQPSSQSDLSRSTKSSAHGEHRDLFGGSFDAFLFDMDGVLTNTATTHASAWKETFDSVLASRATERNEPFIPFSIEDDYLRYVDGKRREDGVRSFLQSRGIDLPDGTPADEPGGETIYAVGNKKNQLLLAVMARDGVETYADTLELLRALKAANAKLGVVSSSANTTAVLTSVGLIDLFEAQIDGVVAAQMSLPGKPAPDTFIKAAEILGAVPGRTVVFEDAEAGVAAGRAGHFGLTVGVDRVNNAEGLLTNGADVVSSDLREFLPTR